MKTLQERLRKSSGDFRLLCLEAANHIDTLEAEVARLREDRDRIGRNRDMWKGQCERQAEQLSASRPQAGEDVVERFTPNEIIMLLHFYCSAAPFDRIHAPACQAAVQRFLAAGWIEPSNKSGNQYHTTAAGTVMVNAICRITSTDRERGLEEAGNAVDLGIAKAKHRCEHWLGRLEAGIDDQEMTFERIIDELRNAGAISDSLKRSQEKG